LLTSDLALARQDLGTLCGEGVEEACQEESDAIIEALCENGDEAACQVHGVGGLL